jgi:alcohol dehydrogenase (cytochrome c)
VTSEATTARAPRRETELSRWWSSATKLTKSLIVIGVLAVLGMLVGGSLYLAFPVPMSLLGAALRNYVLSLDAPPGTETVESNASYTGAPSTTSTPTAEAAPPSGTGNDWPSYNRTVSSDRYSPLTDINTTNAGRLKILCTYDVGEFASFESGLIEVNNALVGTTEYDIFSLNPSTCALNWRTHEDYPGSLLPSNRGAAYLDGVLFRGTQDGRVLAYDFKTGKRLWETRIADAKLGESVPAAPIVWDGRVYIGNAGGDFKGGKGHMYALDAKTGKILWEFYMTPRTEGDSPRGPVGASPLADASSWHNAPHIPITGAGAWTSYTLDVKNGLLYVPGGNPGPDFESGAREGSNLYSDSLIVLDAKTGDYRHHYKLVPIDWHDWDASSPPILIHTMGGRDIVAIAPKNGFLYAFDLSNNNQLYRVPVTRIENVEEPFSPDKEVHFCPGAAGGEEWNSPSYIPKTNLILVGEVDWCDTVRLRSIKSLGDMSAGQPWAGNGTMNPFWSFGKFSKADGNWAGWLYAVDADTGVWKWRVKTNYPIMAAWTPTAGGVVFFGDLGGNLYALDADTGQKLWGQQISRGALGGGVITYMADGAQKVAVAAGVTGPALPTKPVHATVVVLGLNERSSGVH